MPVIRESKKVPGSYVLNGTYSQKEILGVAESILHERFLKVTTNILVNPKATRDYISLRVASLDKEVFSVIYVNAQNGVIAVEDLFIGTLDGASVYPREVVKAVLRHNAAGVIFFHNHPSGVSEPSDSDRRITERLANALRLFDIQVLDHVVVGMGDCVSFAERGYL